MVDAHTVESSSHGRRAGSRRRIVIVALALLAAFGFALAMQSPWWSAGEASIGPFGSRHCFGGECREAGLSWLGGTELWLRSGVAVTAAGYIAMFVLIVVAGAVAARRIPRVMAGSSIVAISTAAVSGGYFAIAFPPLPSASIGRGVVLFAASIVTGLAAAVITLRTGPTDDGREASAGAR